MFSCYQGEGPRRCGSVVLMTSIDVKTSSTEDSERNYKYIDIFLNKLNVIWS